MQFRFIYLSLFYSWQCLTHRACTVENWRLEVITRHENIPFLTRAEIISWLISYSITVVAGKVSNICWFQLLKCDDLLLFVTIYESKWREDERQEVNKSVKIEVEFYFLFAVWFDILRTVIFVKHQEDASVLCFSNLLASKMKQLPRGSASVSSHLSARNSSEIVSSPQALNGRTIIKPFNCYPESLETNISVWTPTFQQL